MIHELLAVHELKFTLQLLEALGTSRSAAYKLDATTIDFEQDIK